MTMSDEPSRNDQQERLVPLPGCLIDRREHLMPEHLADIMGCLGLSDLVSSCRNVVIKANLVAGTYATTESHALTDLVLLREVIGGIRAMNPSCRILIAESDNAGNGYAFLKFRRLGLDTWRMDNVTLLDLSRDTLKQVDLSGARYFNNTDRQLWLSETLLEADMVVSMANLKTHTTTIFTGTCKNLFGLLPCMDKEQYHPYIHAVIHDLARAVPSSLNILDGYAAMEGDGPIEGKPVNLQSRVFSVSPVLADIVGCRMVRLDPRRVTHLEYLMPKDPIDDHFECPRHDIVFRNKRVRFFTAFGLLLQRTGIALSKYGYRLSYTKTLTRSCALTLRTLFPGIFDSKRVKRWKKRLPNRQ